MDYIAKAVDMIVDRYQTRDPFQLCRELHVQLLYMDLYPDLKAFYACKGRQYRIVINSRIPEYLHRILAAHELAHHLEHRSIAGATSYHEFELYNSQVSVEYEANLFAAELLLTDEQVMEMLHEDTSFFRVARELEVPPELLDFKFRLMLHRGYRIIPQYLAQSDFLKKPL